MSATMAPEAETAVGGPYFRNTKMHIISVPDSTGAHVQVSPNEVVEGLIFQRSVDVHSGLMPTQLQPGEFPVWSDTGPVTRNSATAHARQVTSASQRTSPQAATRPEVVREQLHRGRSRVQWLEEIQSTGFGRKYGKGDLISLATFLGLRVQQSHTRPQIVERLRQHAEMESE